MKLSKIEPVDKDVTVFALYHFVCLSEFRVDVPPCSGYVAVHHLEGPSVSRRIQVST